MHHFRVVFRVLMHHFRVVFRVLMHHFRGRCFPSFIAPFPSCFPSFNAPFPSCFPSFNASFPCLFQNEPLCEIETMHSDENVFPHRFIFLHTHFYTKGFARRLVFKQRHNVNFKMNHHTPRDLVLLNFIHH